MALDKHPSRRVALASMLVVFATLDALALASRVAPDESIDFAFPLTSGTYYVLQGGNSGVTNPFHALSGAPLALDIAKLNRFGNRANGVAPASLDAYEIFGDIVYSPCAGMVSTVRDDQPDNRPGNPSSEANYIVLRCGDIDVDLVHMMRGGIAVVPGNIVDVGQPLGRVGNSGYTLEPHLHIGARRGGKNIGMKFNGRFLSINSVVGART